MKRPFQSCITALLLSCALPATPTAHGAPSRYTVTEIGPLPGTGHYRTDTSGLNNVGQVLAYSASNVAYVVALYENGQLHALPGFPSNSEVRDINDAGTIIALANGRAFRYDNGSVQDLGSLRRTGDGRTAAHGINAAGTIVGMATDDNNTYRTFVYENGVMRDLGLPGASWGHDINNAGQIVGALNPLQATTRAYLYDNGTVTELGHLGGGYSVATAINDNGTIVGNSRTAAGTLRAFIYENGVMQDLGSFDPLDESFVIGINNLGQVIGQADLNIPTAGVPFLWENGTMYKLLDLVDPSFKWRLDTRVTDINDQGQIAGWGCWGSQECRGFILTPVPEPSVATTPAPEPGAAAQRDDARQAADGTLRALSPRKP